MNIARLGAGGQTHVHNDLDYTHIFGRLSQKVDQNVHNLVGDGKSRYFWTMFITKHIFTLKSFLCKLATNLLSKYVWRTHVNLLQIVCETEPFVAKSLDNRCHSSRSSVQGDHWSNVTLTPSLTCSGSCCFCKGSFVTPFSAGSPGETWRRPWDGKYEHEQEQWAGAWSGEWVGEWAMNRRMSSEQEQEH